MKAEATDVLIVGAGPTGLALSIALHQRGVRHILIDRLEQGHNTSRAGVIHAHTLEALAQLGVVDELVRLGLKVSTFVIRDRDRVLLELPFDRLPSQHDYLLMLPQNQTEAVLARRIGALGGSVRRGTEALSIAPHEHGARVTVVSSGEPAEIHARWVVGGDGARSLVRSAMGTEFEGSTYSDSFILADVLLEEPVARPEVALLFSPQGLVVLAPLPNGCVRVVATKDDAPETPTAADLQAILDSRGPRGEAIRVRAVTWSSRFRLHHRVAATYRQGPLILMGDAAHLHSPAGGQGMNTGLVDAVVLGELLADVVLGVRDEAAIDLYPALRRPAAVQVLALAHRLTRLATMRNPVTRWLRNRLLSLAGRIPPLERRIAMDLSGLSRAALAQVPQAGTTRALPPRNHIAPSPVVVRALEET